MNYLVGLVFCRSNEKVKFELSYKTKDYEDFQDNVANRLQGIGQRSFSEQL